MLGKLDCLDPDAGSMFTESVFESSSVFVDIVILLENLSVFLWIGACTEAMSVSGNSYWVEISTECFLPRFIGRSWRSGFRNSELTYRHLTSKMRPGNDDHVSGYVM